MEQLHIPPSGIPRVSKQITINHMLTVPDHKPEVDCIIDATVDIHIIKAVVIDTPVHINCHPVRKVIVIGKAQIIVKYVAKVINQQVHAAVFHIPFEALIKWPGGPPAGTEICVGVTVEHFQIDPLDYRDLMKVLLIRLDVYHK
ncbi:DUF3794 domain-containing protein [Metallumcola ferriviriculae]|uniref:DUF3794 domain-containing protein n=1 Tax=Metallumcola ferriviriculae TaxID=3039180 RepID=A0AAU0UM98_9FIRM|nr:DUF3794 domain-containing protein [Desulfitibacteraceae bacterium MK1]